SLLILRSPPVVERRETALGPGDRPIELGREVVDPAFAKPETGVGVQLGVRAQAGHTGWFSRAPDAERTDADEHPRLPLLDPFVELRDEAVDVGAPPVFATPELALAVLRPRRRVGEGNRLPAANAPPVDANDRRPRFAIRIEVVVEVDRIDVV